MEYRPRPQNKQKQPNLLTFERSTKNKLPNNTILRINELKVKAVFSQR